MVKQYLMLVFIILAVIQTNASAQEFSGDDSTNPVLAQGENKENDLVIEENVQLSPEELLDNFKKNFNLDDLITIDNTERIIIDENLNIKFTVNLNRSLYNKQINNLLTNLLDKISIQKEENFFKNELIDKNKQFEHNKQSNEAPYDVQSLYFGDNKIIIVHNFHKYTVYNLNNDIFNNLYNFLCNFEAITLTLSAEVFSETDDLIDARSYVKKIPFLTIFPTLLEISPYIYLGTDSNNNNIKTWAIQFYITIPFDIKNDDINKIKDIKINSNIKFSKF